MGTGDWNDGMNLVGHHGRGESVWLGFFLCEVLARFGALARERGDEANASKLRERRVQLQARLEGDAWDGAWYRRAYFDDGSPLGSSTSAECQIDSIAQSWSVLSNTASPERARPRLDALHARLVKPEQRLVALLDPPFDQRGPNPGYIAGYVPGVRENGGQYTHGAIWAAMAFAALGQREARLGRVRPDQPGPPRRDAEGMARYKVEPYVVAADVYSVAPHTGRGGWSWYTGSAGWMYRLVVESLLGLRLQTTEAGARLLFTPCLPADWPGYALKYRYRETTYAIDVTASSGDRRRHCDRPRRRRAAGRRQRAVARRRQLHEVRVRGAGGREHLTRPRWTATPRRSRGLVVGPRWSHSCRQCEGARRRLRLRTPHAPGSRAAAAASPASTAMPRRSHRCATSPRSSWPTSSPARGRWRPALRSRSSARTTCGARCCRR
jgi:cellobiose phosphorylase